ncbi:MAG: cytochrome c [Chthoniobacteraceae bacterium]
MRIITVIVLFAVSLAAASGAEPAAVDLPGIHNAFRVTDRIFSGSQPADDAAFAALASAGVKTIISVDGGRPDVAAAKRHGLRYVHLPIGYDGIPSARVPEFVKAATETEGRIFIHCHHGKHRGPAAAGILCEAVAGWTSAEAEDWLRRAGTGADYPGLYRAVREFSAPTKEQIAGAGPLREIAKTAGLVDAMVAIDAQFDALKAAQRTGWKIPPGDPAMPAAANATLLREQFRELARAPHTAKRPDSYRKHLAESENAAAALLELVRRRAQDTNALDAAFHATTQSCTACHEAFRNTKE